MAKVQTNGVQYHLLVEGEGEPLLMLHGFTGSLANWEQHNSLLSGDLKTIRVDLLGHGQSDIPPYPARYSMENSAEDIKTLLHTLDIRPVNLLGYSMGGRLALYLALAHPELVSRLILESASPGLKRESERRDRINRDAKLADAVETKGIEAFVDRWELLPLFATQTSLPFAARDGLRKQRLSNDAAGLANSLRGMGTGAQPSLWHRLEELKMPVLILAGALDHKFAELAAEMALPIPAASVKIVPGAGHTIHLERPQLFVKLITQFLGH